MPERGYPCTVCGVITRSKFQLCQMHKRPQKTDTHAWCSKGKHMVEHSGFAKNQNTCRACRLTYYNRALNYSEGKTCIGCGTPVCNTNITGRCQACSVEYRREQRKLLPPRRYINAQGYAVLTSQWGVPNCDTRGRVLEHVKVMAEMIGRPVVPGENVHHLNGVRDDNRPENLELWSRSQPAGQRVTDKVEWAKHILATYEPEALQPREGD